jgi:hypothetical protein
LDGVEDEVLDTMIGAMEQRAVAVDNACGPAICAGRGRGR